MGLSRLVVLAAIGAILPAMLSTGCAGSEKVKGIPMPEVDVRTGFADVNGAKLYYEVRGNGHALVLVHAFFFDQRMWDEQANALAQRFRVVRYDVRGFGRSNLPSTPYSDIEDLRALLDHLGIERTYILGLSMGGGIAIDFTLEHPERVDGLIAAASALRGRRPSPDLSERVESIDSTGASGDRARAIEMFIETWIDGPISPSSDAVRARARALMDGYTFSHYLESAPKEEFPAVPSAVGRLSSIRVPTLVIVGDREQPFMRETADLLGREIRGAQFVLIPGAAHLVNLDRPAEFNRTVLEFLTGLE